MICFLDMDGVLVNFNKGCFIALGLKYDYEHPALQEWEWFKRFGLSLEEFDSFCNEQFWASLQWMHNGREILKEVEEAFGKENIYLLTTPMPNEGSATGKVQWVKRHMPEYQKRLIITTVPKEIFAARDRVLIDDKTENCTQFADSGGWALLVPRPWNTNRNYITMSYVKERLAIWKGRKY